MKFFITFVALSEKAKQKMDNRTLIDILSKKLDTSRETVGLLIDGLADCLGEAGAQLDSVVIPSFGVFEPKKRLERVAMHPASGKRLLVPPKVTLNFKPTAALKQSVNKTDNSN